MKKFIIITAIVLFAALIIYSGYYWFQKAKEGNETKKQEVAKQNLVTNTENQIGGEIIKDGFNITYESGKGRFIITVTNDPFEENKNKALEYLESQGIKTCDLNYLVLPGRGVTITGSNGTPVNTCGIGE